MPEQPSNLDCRECMDLLSDYVDGSASEAIQAELLEWHLEGCQPCVSFVNTYKGTVDAARRLRETTLPPSFSKSWSPSSSAPRALTPAAGARRAQPPSAHAPSSC